MIGLKISSLVVELGGQDILKEISLDIRSGEKLFVLGPSGSGKSTLLRAIAGFNKAKSGSILLNDRDITTLHPSKRETALVFQNYALWPHMTVFQNVSFGLKVKKYNKLQIKERVEKILALTKLAGFEERYPDQLSGGQQQRVALARSLVVEPELIMLDEPLSNLDSTLRKEMRAELDELHSKLKFTMIFVTHDQSDALALADRIAILKEGRLLQVASPDQLVLEPNSSFIKQFLGNPMIILGTSLSGKIGTPIGNLEGESNLSEGEKVQIILRQADLLIRRQ